MIAGTLASRLVSDLPVDPDADRAREWLSTELGKPPYQAARPTWFDLLAQGFQDWLDSLRLPDGSGLSLQGIVTLIIVLVVVALIVVAFVVYGRPRLNRRSKVAPGALFGSDDTRSSEELRRSAGRAAAAGDFRLAIEEAFRALARQLAERTVVSTAPGTTAQDFARRAASAFPPAGDELRAGAGLFDGVRYLEQPGSRAEYERIAALDRRLQTERPVRLEPVVSEPVR